MGISFAKAEIFDLEYIAEVLESILPMYKELIPGAFEKQIQKFRSTKTLPSNYEIWLILEKNEPIGFLGVASLSNDVVYLAAFYIHSDYHRLRLGSLAIEQLCELFAEKGYEEIVLFAHSFAEWAIKFYLQHNFQVVTDKMSKIHQYKGGILADYFLPNPVLMSRYL